MSDFPPPPPPVPSLPPGYVAYGGPGAYGGHFAKIGGLSRALVVLSIISLAAALANVLVQLGLRGEARDTENSVLTSSAFENKLGVLLLVVVVIALVGIATIVLQCMWTYRMAANLRLLQRGGQTWGPGWGIGVWILAGCTLSILPYLMLRELWKGSDPQVPPGDPTWKQRVVSGIVNVWFGLQVATVVLAFGAGVGATFGFGRSASNIAKSINDRFAFVVIGGLTGVASSIAFILLVRSLSARHMQATAEA